jgi:hypothetical protein
MKRFFYLLIGLLVLFATGAKGETYLYTSGNTPSGHNNNDVAYVGATLYQCQRVKVATEVEYNSSSHYETTVWVNGSGITLTSDNFDTYKSYCNNGSYYKVAQGDDSFKYYKIEEGFDWVEKSYSNDYKPDRDIVGAYSDFGSLPVASNSINEKFAVVGGKKWVNQNGVWVKEVTTVETSWNSETHTLTIGTDETRTLSEILGEGGYNVSTDDVQKIVFADESEWNRKTDGGHLTATESESEHAAALKAAGFPISYYESGTLTLGAGDETTANLRGVVNALSASGATRVVFPDGAVWDNATGKLTAYPFSNATAYENALTEAGFRVSSTDIVTNYPDVTITVDDNGVVTITSRRAGAAKELLDASDAEATAVKALLSATTSTKLVFAGPLNADDLAAVASEDNDAVTSVNMSGATFENYNDMKFTYWSNTLEKATTSVNAPGNFVISNSAFSGCTRIQEVVFNSGIIGSNVLGQNDNDHHYLTKVTIGSGVTELKDQAFNKCPITDLDWSNATSLQVIGKEAFEECPFTNVSTLTIPASVREIKEKAFFNICKSLENVGTGGVKNIVIPEDSHLNEVGIGEKAFWLEYGLNAYNPLKDVYVNCDQEIPCHPDAFSFINTDGQSQEAKTTARTRLHYPPNHYEFYVGSYKSAFGGNGIWTQSDLITNRDDRVNTNNGWRRFTSAGILMTYETTWRTYSDVVALTVPAVASKIDVYLVCDYQNGSAILVKMKAGDCIPAGTGILVHYEFSKSQGGGTLFFRPYDVTGYGEDDLRPYQTFNPDDKRIQPVSEGGEGLKTHKYRLGEVDYDNFLEGIHESSRYIYNAENGNYLNYDDYKMAAYPGQKVTYRNFFFNNGDNIVKWAEEDNKVWYYTGNGIKGFDPNKEGKMGWGFFRVISDIYTVNSKAFLRLPASKFTDPKGGSMIASDNGVDINDVEVTTGAKGMGLIILGEEELEEQQGIATAITSPDVKTVIDSDSFYTLQGVKVNTPTTRGLYIHNGKKVVVK